MIRTIKDGMKSIGYDSEAVPSTKTLRLMIANWNSNKRRRRSHCIRMLVFLFFVSRSLSTAYVLPRMATSATISTLLPPLTLRSSTSTPLFESRAFSTPNVSGTKEKENDHDVDASSVEELLRKCAYGERIIKLDFDNTDGHLLGQRIVKNVGRDDEEFSVLPFLDGVLAEIQDGGKSRICRILGIKTTASKKTKKKASESHEETSSNCGHLTHPPRLKVALIDAGDSNTIDKKENLKTIDVGQITTIWTAPNDKEFEEALSTESFSMAAVCDKVEQILPVNRVDDVFEIRYKYHVGRGRNIHGGGALTKKQVQMLSAAASVAASSSTSTFEQTEELRKIIDLVLKQCVRCGSKYSRLLDSAMLEEYMFYEKVEGVITHDHTSGSDTSSRERRIFCAMALAEDTETAGRFKRVPCMWLPPPMKDNYNEIASSSSSSTTLSFVNGGWVVVDQSVRAAAEGRKFAASATASGGKFINTSNNERILCRLESLACGEKLKQQKNGVGAGIRLEVDVRTTLESMNLPLSSEGAQEALFRMGRWTKMESRGKDNKGYERWSASVLEAAKWYDEMDRVRRRDMKSKILELRARGQNQNQLKEFKKPSTIAVLEGRIDLTNLPCICIDTERASFRDDAFGIRKRSTTGRRVNKKASQWELLFHIADVSDIYATNPMVVGSQCASGTAQGQSASAKTSVIEQKEHLRELHKAARSRIRSEYDLPLGPLHLLPTSVLKSMSLDAFKQDWTSDPSTWPNSWHSLDKEKGAVNRAVTLWVYIDERSGFVIDIGFERSIISRPLALTFETSTKLLDASDQQQKKFPPMLTKARVLLGVVERNIEIWSDARQKKSDEARAREERLAAKELISEQVYGGRNSKWKRRDDGQEGFRRNRGHRLVDSTLNLYENAFRMMLQRNKAMVPQHAVSRGKDNGSRSATAPLRYYLQGLAQRQALAVLCDYGGTPISNEECKKIGSKATSALNARKHTGVATHGPRVVSQRQLAAVRSLRSHLQKHRTKVVPAISTGKNSEVVIQGVGAVAFCKEIPGTIKTGVKVMVRILEVDDKNGKVVVALQNKN